MDLRSKLDQGQFVITLEVDPPRGSSPKTTLEQVASIRQCVDAVNIADCPMANLRMSPIALAHLIQEEMGVETVFHLTCRDRNVIGLQAELLGAAALGVKNVLALTGDKPSSGDHPQTIGVYEVDSTGLVALAEGLNRGVSYTSRPIGDPTDFFIGVASNPCLVLENEVELSKLKAKIAAGARFTQTQPVFDLQVAERFAEMADSLGIHVIFGILPLKSVRSMNYLKTKVPGIMIPSEVEDRMLNGHPDEGLRIAAELIAGIRRLGKSVHLFPLGDPAVLLRILDNTAARSY